MTNAKQDDPGLFADIDDTEEILVDDSDGVDSGESVQATVLDEHLTEECCSAGACLRRRRLELGLSPDQVAQDTKIKPSHILALEEGDLDELPQPVHPVYLVASVKKLGAFYGLDSETLEEITAGLKEQIQCLAPDDMSKSCHGHEVSEESIRQQKRLLIILLALAGTFLLLITAGIVLLVRFFLFSPDEKVLNTPFDPNVLLEIQPKVELKITPLPAVED